MEIDRNEKLLTIPAVSRMLGLNRLVIERLLAEKKLKYLRISSENSVRSHRRILNSSVQELLREGVR